MRLLRSGLMGHTLSLKLQYAIQAEESLKR
jgi:hypothetical protein